MSPSASATPSGTLPVCLVYHHHGGGSVEEQGPLLRRLLSSGEGQEPRLALEEGQDGGRRMWVWAVDNKYYTARVHVKVKLKYFFSLSSRFSHGNPFQVVSHIPEEEEGVDPSPEAAVAVLSSSPSDDGPASLRSAISFLRCPQASDCDVRLLVIERDSFDAPDASAAAALCLEEAPGVELVDRREGQEEEEEEDDLRWRPCSALQACMWSNMERKVAARAAEAEASSSTTGGGGRLNGGDGGEEVRHANSMESVLWTGMLVLSH